MKLTANFYSMNLATVLIQLCHLNFLVSVAFLSFFYVELLSWVFTPKGKHQNPVGYHISIVWNMAIHGLIMPNLGGFRRKLKLCPESLSPYSFLCLLTRHHWYATTNLKHIFLLNCYSLNRWSSVLQIMIFALNLLVQSTLMACKQWVNISVAANTPWE